MSDDPLRYPVGNLAFVASSPELRRTWIQQFRDAPGALRAAVAGLNEKQLLTPYRPEGWTVAQEVRHLAVMVVNSSTRLKQNAWHARHHTAHITSLRARMGW